jgi:hypothetical protein
LSFELKTPIRITQILTLLPCGILNEVHSTGQALKTQNRSSGNGDGHGARVKKNISSKLLFPEVQRIVFLSSTRQAG